MYIMVNFPRIERKGLVPSKIEITQSMLVTGRREKNMSNNRKNKLNNTREHKRKMSMGKTPTKIKMPTTNTSDFNKFHVTF